MFSKPDYNSFRTGLSFDKVFQILKTEARRKESNGERMFITRHTVLGRWREIKLKMFEYYILEEGR